MVNVAHVNIKDLGGMVCSREEQCLNPKQARLKIGDFIVIDTVCKYCRQKQKAEKKKRELRKAGKQPRKPNPKPSFWKEFTTHAWDCRGANELIKRAWV